MIELVHFQVVAAALFAIGLYGGALSSECGLDIDVN